MTRRILSILLLAALVVGLLPLGIVSVSAYNEGDIAYPVEGGNLYFDKATGTIMDCDEKVTKADIPAEIDGVAVTSIDHYAFYYNTNLTSVTIPDSVTSIGYGAFTFCSSLTSVTIPRSVASIGDSVFRQCFALTAVEVAEGNTAYCSENGVLFDKAHSALLCYPAAKAETEYSIPSGVTSIRPNAFFACKSLTSVTLPDSVTSIGDYAFYGCKSLISAMLPDSVTSIGDYAFYGCESLISAMLPDSVTSIGEHVFHGCSSLVTVTLPDSVTSIGEQAFYGCGSLTGVTLPSSLTSLGNGAFYGCKGLTDVTLPDSLTSIGGQALSDCSGLASITIPDGVTSIGWGAFSGTAFYNAEDNWIDDVLYIGSWLIEANDSVAGAYAVREGTVGIADSAFNYCRELTGVTLPAGLIGIGGQAFYCCKGLTDITIPDGVTSIGEEAFSSCDNLVDITLPNSLTSIGRYAFSSCSSLADITLPNGLTSIGEGAFENCGSLTGITLPDSLTTLGGYAFSRTAFYNEEGNWTDNVLYIGSWLIEANDSVAGAYAVREGTVGIADSAFNHCRELTGVTLPDSLTSIGKLAFYGCSALRAVYFMGDAPVLGNSVFQITDEETRENINIPGLTLYYIEGKAGWTSPTWNGYPTAVWTPDDHIHSYHITVTAPTCTEKGYTTYTCECGDSYSDTYVDAIGHKYENGICSVCGAKDPDDKPAEPAVFTDVAEKAWYHDAVEYAVTNGLMKGVGNGKFDPEGSMTRAMLVTVLWRYEGEPAEGENIFTDVPNGTWYTDAVAWAAANGIVGGVGNNKFDPEGKITREQMATILFRYAQKKGIDTSKRGELSGFPDSGKVSSWAKDAIQWAVAEEIINGSDGKLLPQGNATRAQVATILMRFIENIVKA